MSDSSDTDFSTPCKHRDSCRTYLLTYSQADLVRYPTCKDFTDSVLEAFSCGSSKSTVQQWATCMEKHEMTGGYHYHMCVKLSATRRWKPVFEYLYKNFQISVNFSSKSYGYLAAYRYVCKDKTTDSVLHSPNHPNLTAVKSPSSKKGTKASAKKAKKQRLLLSNEKKETEPSNKKAKRLSNPAVAKFLVENNIKTENQFMAIAKSRLDNGQSDIYDFITSRPKGISDLIRVTWKIEEASALVERESKSRMEIIHEFSNKTCVENCNGDWLTCAREVLRNNNINIYVFSDALRQAIEKGRQKNVNILLVGPTNCGKSFLLNPVEHIFKCFVNPATGKYAWVGLDECELAYLNDFRWSQELIAWNDFLLLLEGQTVHLPRPKNQFASDMIIPKENTIPFLATSKAPIEYYGKYNARDDKETDMMSSRWRTFVFTQQIPSARMRVMPACAHCFSTLVLQGIDA